MGGLSLDAWRLLIGLTAVTVVLAPAWRAEAIGGATGIGVYWRIALLVPLPHPDLLVASPRLTAEKLRPAPQRHRSFPAVLVIFGVLLASIPSRGSLDRRSCGSFDRTPSRRRQAPRGPPFLQLA